MESKLQTILAALLLANIVTFAIYASGRRNTTENRSVVYDFAGVGKIIFSSAVGCFSGFSGER